MMVKTGLGASSCSFFSSPDDSTASLRSPGATNRIGNDLAAMWPCIGALSLALQRCKRHIVTMPTDTVVADLESRALIAVGGADWRGFLQGLITQDVETLGPGELRFGALLTPQGRLLFDLFILGRTDGCWLDCQAAGRAALMQRLMIYR